MSTLTDGTTTANLHNDLQWVDEFAWNAVAQKSGRTITGALWVEEAALSAVGRPITLQGDEQTGWISRSDLLNLRTLAQIAGASLTLTITPRSQTFTVMFDHEAGNPIDARPVVGYSDIAAGDWYYVTLRFKTIA